MNNRIRNTLTHLGKAKSFVTLALLTLAFLSCAKDSDRSSLVVASYGGAWQEAQRQAFFDPFENSRNISIVDVPYDGQFAKIKEMAISGAVEWDVVDVEGNMVVLGAKEGILEAIDYGVVDKANFIEGATHEYGVGIVAWSWVLAFRRGEIGDDLLLTPWKTLFDPELVPGARGLRNDPRRTLEIALLADGVDPQALYPVDVDRAFAFLTAFRKKMNEMDYPIVWWDEYARPSQLLQDNEVVLTPAANGRIAGAVKEGARLEFSWRHGLVDVDWWVVTKGTSNRALAMDFLAFCSLPQQQAEIAKLIPYGPVNPAAAGLLPGEVRRELPTVPTNLEQQLLFDTQWWSDNYEAILDRWNSWLASGG